MHLSEDGFVELVKQTHDSPRVDAFGDERWPVVWQAFLSEASRFDSRKLLTLFGSTSPVRRPSLDPQKMTRVDRLLIGEFLRRHHSRLAHQIALAGVPDSAEKQLCLIGFPPDLLDLFGVVARSHGLPLRSCFDYLRTEFDLREYKGIHAVFLMSLLRISDYLQIQAKRAPSQLLKVRRLRSPISKGEWAAHHAINDIRHTHEDPEAIFIQASPKDIKTYLRIKEWLSGIQAEIDTAWAVFGEVYGRYSGLNTLGLRLRRVCSNLDDETAFAKTVDYVPTKASFETTEADLLKLLVFPLYGPCGGIGIRELVQNAVDAVRELKEYCKQRSGLDTDDMTTQEADVVISLERRHDGSNWVVVSDRGVGMTAKVIQEYFLKAGSTLRRSETWRRQFEDDTGRSRVLRSGKFGIGVLAAFLLGDEIHVSTRHIDAPENEGIEFSAKLETEIVELRRISRQIGTSVSVRISQGLRKLLRGSINVPRSDVEEVIWDWYCLDEPNVLRLINPGSQRLPQKYHIPSAGSKLPPTWRRIKHPDYADVQWSYWEGPTLSCNGILISDHYDRGFKSFGFGSSVLSDHPENCETITISVPNISVFDPDAKYPLSLTRECLLTKKQPFHDQLLEDVSKDLIAFCLVSAPTQPLPRLDLQEWLTEGYPGLIHTVDRNAYGHVRNNLWVYGREGVSVLDGHFMRAAGIRRVVFFPVTKSTSWIPTRELITELPIAPVYAHGWMPQEPEPFEFYPFREKETKEPTASRSIWQSLFRDDFAGSRILLRKTWVDTNKQTVSRSEVEWESDDWILLMCGKCPRTDMDFEGLSSALSQHWEKGVPGIILESYLSERPDDSIRHSYLVDMWLRIVGTPLIPYDPIVRRQKLARAFRILNSYVKAHEALQAQTPESAV